MDSKTLVVNCSITLPTLTYSSHSLRYPLHVFSCAATWAARVFPVIIGTGPGLAGGEHSTY